MYLKTKNFKIRSLFFFLILFLVSTSPIKVFADDQKKTDEVESSEGKTSEAENQSLLDELLNTKSEHSPKIYKRNTVEIEKTIDISNSYKKRKLSKGILVGLQRIQYSPTGFNSMLDGRSFEDAYNSPINVINFQAERKYNFDLFSFGFGIGYLSGSSSGEFGQQLTLRGPAVSASFLIDGLAEEPFVAPFLNLQFSNVTLQEENDYLNADVNYNLSSIITLGAHVQLNWIDELTAFQALNDVGLENSYLTLAIVMSKINTAQINMESNITVPDLSMDSALKVGVTLEF